MDRRTLGGWISGPGYGLPDTAQDYRGQLLGLPEDGPGSVAGLGRRIGALTLDWFIAVFITRLVFPGVEYGSEASSLLVMATFALMTVVLLWLLGATIGQRLLGIHIVRLGGDGRLGLFNALIRTLLLCLVIPAVVWDRDQRGLHDKAARSVVLRSR